MPSLPPSVKFAEGGLKILTAIFLNKLLIQLTYAEVRQIMDLLTSLKSTLFAEVPERSNGIED